MPKIKVELEVPEEFCDEGCRLWVAGSCKVYNKHVRGSGTIYDANNFKRLPECKASEIKEGKAK